jgi:chromosome segregation ATPase
VIAVLKLVPAWVWAVIALVALLVAGLVYQTLALGSVRAEYATYQADIAQAARDSEEKARRTEQQRQTDIQKVRDDAYAQKQADDALAALQRADNDSLRKQTDKLLSDRAALNSRLAARGKTIGDLTDLLAQLRSEADGTAGELASALTGSRRAGFACERAYNALIVK